MAQDKYFREELAYLREQGKVFSETFPQLSCFLQSRSYDPDIERLLEGFAFLTARLRAKVDDEFPELTHSIINMLWPNYLRPVPSLAIVTFVPEKNLSERHCIRKGTVLDSKPIKGTVCHFRTCRNVDLYPLSCKGIHAERTREHSTVTIQLEGVGESPISSLDIQSLRFYLGGDRQSAQTLYLWMNHYLEHISVDIAGESFPLSSESISLVGFDKNDALLPYPKNVSDGYRILQEYLAFPEAFHFIEIDSIGKILPVTQACDMSIQIHFNKTLPSDVLITKEHFQLHCVPVVNLFSHDADPINLTGKRSEYLVAPSSRHPSHFEVFSVDSVIGRQDTSQNEFRIRGQQRIYTPFESFQHEVERVNNRKALYYRSRVKNSVRGDGFETFISFVRSDETVLLDVDETVSLKISCTNRQLPSLLGIGDICVSTDTSPTFAQFYNISAPTQALRPVLDGSLLWVLISNMSLNYLSLLSKDSLKSVLGAYDFKALVDRQAQRIAQMRMDGLIEIETHPIDRFIQGYPVRGLRSLLILNEQGFGSEGGLYLFGTVLSHFFALYASINSFHELVVVNETNKEEYRWEIQIGTQPLI